MASYSIPSPSISSGMNNFRSVVANGNDFAKAARFAVVINGMGEFGRELAYLCEAAELPGRALSVDDVRYYGPSFKMPFQSAYQDFNVTILCRNFMYEKEVFDRWIEFINPKSTYDFAYRTSYETTIDVYQFSEIASYGTFPQATYKQTLRHAYPIFVNPIPLNWAEDNINRLQVTFTYTDWITLSDDVDSSAFNLINVPTTDPNIFVPIKTIR